MPMFRAPGVGETVKVKVDPKKGEAKFDKSDPTISLDAENKLLKEEEGAEVDRALREGPAGD
jgi:hypothetical protein